MSASRSKKPPADATRTDRLVAVQAHVSALLVLAGALFAATAWRLAWQPRYGRAGVAACLAAAVVALVAASGPWAWQQRVAGQRRLIAAALLACGGGLVALAPGVSYLAVIGAQATLTAAILTEVGIRRGSLTWLWGSILALVIPATLYWWLVIPRGMSD